MTNSAPSLRNNIIGSYKKAPFQEFAKDLTAVCIIISILYIATHVLSGLNRDYIVIEPFEVPNDIYNGYTGKTIASKFSAEIDSVIKTSCIVNNAVIIDTGVASNTDIVIPGPANTIRSVIFNIKEQISKPLFIVTGYIVRDNDKLKLRVRIKGEKRLTLKNANSDIVSSNNNIDEMIRVAAMNVVVQIDPLLAAGHYYNKFDDNAVISICNILKDGPKFPSITYFLWANALFRQKNYKEALKKIEIAGSYKNSTALDYHINMLFGDILRKLNKYDEAIVKYKLAMTDNSGTSQPHYMVADALILQNKHKEAIFHLKRGLEMEAPRHGGWVMV